MTIVAAPARTGQITIMRAGVAVLVVYSYLVGLWLQQHGANPQPLAGIREWFNRPLRAGEDFGPLALMVLLLCTGWTTAGSRRLPDLLRFVLPVAVAALVGAALQAMGLDVWAVDGWPVPLAWVAVLQVVAWLVGFDRLGWPAPAALLVAIGVLVLLDVDELGRQALFLTLALGGHVARRVADGVLPMWAGLALGAGCFAVVAALDETTAGLGQWWYPVAATYAVLVFLAVLGTPVTPWPVVGWLADRAEWLLVASGVIGFAVLGLGHLRVPLSVAILAAIAATFLAADTAYRLTRRFT